MIAIAITFFFEKVWSRLHLLQKLSPKNRGKHGTRQLHVCFGQRGVKCFKRQRANRPFKWRQTGRLVGWSVAAVRANWAPFKCVRPPASPPSCVCRETHLHVPARAGPINVTEIPPAVTGSWLSLRTPEHGNWGIKLFLLCLSVQDMTSKLMVQQGWTTPTAFNEFSNGNKRGKR